MTDKPRTVTEIVFDVRKVNAARVQTETAVHTRDATLGALANELVAALRETPAVLAELAPNALARRVENHDPSDPLTIHAQNDDWIEIGTEDSPEVPGIVGCAFLSVNDSTPVWFTREQAVTAAAALITYATR